MTNILTIKAEPEAKKAGIDHDSNGLKQRQEFGARV
jgi:hypothetical protein